MKKVNRVDTKTNRTIAVEIGRPTLPNNSIHQQRLSPQLQLQIKVLHLSRVCVSKVLRLQQARVAPRVSAQEEKSWEVRLNKEREREK